MRPLQGDSSVRAPLGGLGLGLSARLGSHARLAVALAVGAFAALSGVGKGDEVRWEWQHPPFRGADLFGVWASGPNDAFAVGAGGTIVHYSGIWWLPTSSGTTQALRDVWGSGPEDVFAVGDGGTVLHYDGTGWFAMESGTSQPLKGVWGNGPDDVFVVGDGGTILRYDGWTWSAMTSGTEASLADVWSSGDSDAFAVGDATILHYDGAGWSVASPMSGKFTGVWGSGPNNVLAVADWTGARLALYDGAVWSEWHERFATDEYHGICGSGPKDVFVVGFDHVNWEDTPRRFRQGRVFRYLGGAPSLTPMETGTKMALNAVWCVGPNDAFAVGAAGTILRYDGAAWSAMAYAAATTDLHRVWTSGPNDVFAVGGQSTALHFGGQSWKRTIGADGWRTYGVWGSGPDDVYVSAYWWDGSPMNPGDPYEPWEYNDPAWLLSRGSHLPWSPVLLAECEPCWPLGQPRWGWSYARNCFFVTGQGGKVLQHDEGVWPPDTTLDTGTSVELTAISGNAPNDVFTVGPEGTIVHYDGSDWSVMDGGTGQWLGGVWCAGPNDVFVVGAIGTILRYDGSGWSAMTSGTAQTLTGVWGSGSADVFAVGAAGTVLHYDGVGWSGMDSGTTRDLNGVWGSGPRDVYIVGEAGTILHYGGYWVTVDVPREDLGAAEVHYSIGHRQALLVATVKPGGLFSMWSGEIPEGRETENPLLLDLESDRVVTALFEEGYLLTVEVTGKGKVEPKGGTYDEGTELILTATPAEGWRFVEWQGDMPGPANPARLVMNADKRITAVFSEVSSGEPQPVPGAGCCGSSLIGVLPFVGLLGGIFGMRRRLRFSRGEGHQREEL
ncbi:MAG: hypothetical protein JXQ73_10790 [Phycisphaerae bacterium]|nr:hypothetical protein [Phycisphaerae bacterium]